MSRVYEALQRSQGDSPSASPLVPDQPEIADAAASGIGVAAATEPVQANWLNVPAERILHPVPTPEQRLVSLAAPDSQGAEMFRVLSYPAGSHAEQASPAEVAYHQFGL